MITEDQLEQLAIQWHETLTPTFSQREKEKERVVIRWLDPAIPEDASATHKNSLSVQIKSKGG